MRHLQRFHRQSSCCWCEGMRKASRYHANPTRSKSADPQHRVLLRHDGDVVTIDRHTRIVLEKCWLWELGRFGMGPAFRLLHESLYPPTHWPTSGSRRFKCWYGGETSCKEVVLIPLLHAQRAVA